ncbi:PAS domain S-box protein [Hymenobacter busanensis]|uniref:histidine kinase n=1 Tax=Hymenobacter busanensis TaxID=2607656 RepID=A0A7L5A1K8_9BACT|nr:PAS domain S-box protein [Hymenobacter busanensis]KAA9338595.1 PAS domain S-box protein [Hymenobacter busanensis]QHJ08976.1 PAS domain S-box protein [Hymenobacter busanensis]
MSASLADDMAGRLHTSSLDELRQRAERRRVVTETLSQKSPEEVQRLVEELQVHQIELEMQYEELLLAQQEAQRVRAQFIDLYDFAPVGYCTLDAHGLIQQLNLRASQLLGTTRQLLQDRRFQLFVAPDNRDAFYQFLQRTLHSEERQTCELEMRRHDGTPFHALLEGLPVATAGTTQVRVTFLDTTEQRRTAQALTTSEAKFRTLFEQSADASVLVHDRRYVDCNQAAVRLLGARDKSQIVGQPLLLNVPPVQPNGRSSRELMEHYLRTVQATGSCQFEWLRHTFAGEPMWMDVTVTPIEVGGQQLLYATWRDITARKRAEEALLASETRFRTLFEQSSDGMLLLQDGRYTACNAAALRLIGAERPEQVVGQPVAVCAPECQPDGRLTAEWFADNVRLAQQQGSLRCEMLMHHFSGRDIWIEGVLTPVAIPEQTTLTHMVWRDVTERRHDVERLRESENRLRAALKSAKLGVNSWNLKTEEVYLDERARAILGLPPEQPYTFDELIGLTHPDDRELLQAAIEQTVHGNEQLNAEYRVVHPGGEVRVVRANGQLTRDEQGAPLQITGVLRDVTERRRDRQRLLDSEERLRLALISSGAGVWEVDLETNALQWDERAQAIFGRAFSSLPGRFAALTEAMHPDDIAAVSAALQASIQHNTPFELEHRVVWPDGTVHHVAATGQAVYSPAGQPLRFVGLVRDVTDRYEAQQEISYQTRLLDRIVHNMPVVLTRVAPDGTLLEVVGAGLQRLGVADNFLNGRNVFDAYPMLLEHMNVLLSGNEVRFLGLPPNRGQQVYFQNYGFFDEERQCGILFAIDVTETQQANAKLKAEKDFSRSLLDTSVDGIVALDASLCVTVLNRVAQQTFGLVESEVVNRKLFELVPELNVPQYRQVLERVLKGELLQRYDLPFRNQYFDAYFAPLQNPNGDITGVLAVIRDVTERNRLATLATQAQLQRQKEVLSAILHTQEDERKRIAEGLHNGVGQLLYATKLHLEHKPVDEEHRAAALGVLNEAIKATRSISFELTPNILEDFGLKTALEELCKRIPQQRLQVHLAVGELPTALPRVLETAIYRIVQELLNNVMKHAQARETFVYVEPAGRHIQVSVEDDGAGFDVETAVNQHSGIGLTGIRNRVGLLGGQLTIRSQPGRGTTISIELPVGSDAQELPTKPSLLA